MNWKYRIDRFFMRALGLCRRCMYRVYWINHSTAVCPYCGSRSHL